MERNNNKGLLNKLDIFSHNLAAGTGRILGANIATTAIVGISTATTALIGETMDQLPYFHSAIPSGIDLAINLFHNVDIKDNLHGNLDKLGAGIGFIGTMAKSYLFPTRAVYSNDITNTLPYKESTSKERTEQK
jgi:hypothetical protein